MLLNLILSLVSLQGSWQQDCQRGLVREEHFQDSSVKFVERNFWDSACQSSAAEAISHGTILLGDPVEKPAGASAIDFTFSSVFLKPLDERAASSWNARAVCGIRSWQSGEEMEVTGKECDFLGLGKAVRVPSSGDKKFGVISLTEEGLFFGRLSPQRDASSPDRRPLELDPRPYRRF